MAHKKAGGSTRNGRDSNAKYLGLKVGDGEVISGGSIIMRQRGTKMLAGDGVGVGRDHTLFALYTGRVSFIRRHNRVIAVVVPVEAEQAA